MRIIGYPLHNRQVIFFLISDSWAVGHTLHGVCMEFYTGRS